MGSNHEKNGGRKSRDTLPLNIVKHEYEPDKHQIEKHRGFVPVSQSFCSRSTPINYTVCIDHE